MLCCVDFTAGGKRHQTYFFEEILFRFREGFVFCGPGCTDIANFLQTDATSPSSCPRPSAGGEWDRGMVTNGVALTRFPQGPPTLWGNPSAPPTSDGECCERGGASQGKHTRTQGGAKRRCQHFFPCLFLP